MNPLPHVHMVPNILEYAVHSITTIFNDLIINLIFPACNYKKHDFYIFQMVHPGAIPQQRLAPESTGQGRSRRFGGRSLAGHIFHSQATIDGQKLLIHRTEVNGPDYIIMYISSFRPSEST